MKKLSIPALVLLGGSTLVGLGVLLSRAFPALLAEGGPAVIAPVLITAVAAALFVLGVFLGFLHSENTHGHSIKKETLERFQEALSFERQARQRIERDLWEAKKMIVNLEDRLGRRARGAPAADKEAKAENPDDVGLRSEIKELVEAREKLKSDLNKRKEQVADLLAELSMAQAEAERLKTSNAVTRFSSLAKGPSIRDVLGAIAAMDGIKMAIVADDYGLVVDSAGEGMPPDILAAISALVAHVGPRVREIMPMGDVATICLGDDQGLVLETKYFELFGARCALAIARDDAHPYPGLAEQATQAIVARFSD